MVLGIDGQLMKERYSIKDGDEVMALDERHDIVLQWHWVDVRDGDII